MQPGSSAGPRTLRQYTLAARPKGMPKESDFAVVEHPAPALNDGDVLIRTQYVSVDPYMRGRMNGVKTYVDPFEIGGAISSGAVGEVIDSRNGKFPAGITVTGMWGWQDYALSDGKGLRVVDRQLGPVSTALGVLGLTGLTAYFGLLEIAQPKPGETVVVSGAAGAVGSIAGQIAKIKGCRVVGIAGSDEKVRHITEDLGFDAGFNYKTESDYGAKLKELCPGGIDCYFENVGGAVGDAVYPRLNLNARVALCGLISQYNLDQQETGPRIQPYLLIRQAKAQGFMVFQYMDRYAEAIQQLAAWMRDGKLKHREEIEQGFENTVRAFIGLFQGENIGKMLVKY